MRGRSGRLSALTPARVLRGVTALTLTFAVSATGVALASPSRAATAPAILTNPTTPNNNPTPTWTFNNTPAPSYECAFDRAAAAAPTFTACPSNGSYTAPALATDGSQDGDYTFRVRETGADATATSTSGVYTLDTVGRVSVVVSAVTNNPTPTWTISPEPGAVTLSGCAFDGAPITCPTGTFTPAAPLADGAHVLRVGITDSLGNTGSGSATTTVDTVAPSAPTVTGSSGLHNTGSVTWSWDAAGSTSSCAYTTPAGTTVVSGCTSPFTRSLGPGGAYSLSVTLTDAAGNTGPAGSSPVYTYDTVRPAAPSAFVEPLTSPVVHTSSNRRPSWSFTTSTATTTCQLTGPATVAGGDCSNGTYAAPVDLADGDWTLVATAVTPAGNTASTSSSVYTVDTVGPVAPTVSTPAADVPHNTAAPSFTWNGELPVTAYCRTVRTDADPQVAVQRTAYSRCDGRVYAAALSGDASYQVEAYLVDPAGNVGAVGISAPWQYDGTAPAAPVLGGVPAKGHDRAVTFTFTPEAGATALCWYTPAGGVDSAKTACDSGSYPVTFPVDGIYTVHAQQTDQATNSSLVGDVVYDLNSTLPSAPTVTAPASPGNARVVTWGLQANDPSVLTCRLLSGATVLVGTTACPTQFVADLTGRADGTYDLEVTATNDHGATRVLTSAYVLDTVAPELAVITGPVSPGSSPDPEWTFPVQPGTTAQCRLVQNLVAMPWSACNSGSFKPGALADGSYTVDVLVTDLAGNTKGVASSAPYTSDRTKPTAPTVVSPVSPGRNPQASWSWSGEPGATATCQLNRAGVIGVPQPCGTTNGTFAPALTGDSSYVVVVQLTDAAGNVSDATTTPAYVLDTTPPAVPTVTGTSGIGNTSSATWTFDVEPGGRAECALFDGSGAPLVFGTCTSGTPVTLPRDGSYRYVVHTFDPAGNQSGDGTGPLYVFDGTKPLAPSVAGPQLSPSQDARPSFAFSAETGTTTECYVLRSGALVRDWYACSSPVALDLTGEVDGSYVLEVRATDVAGNTSDPGASLEYVLDRRKPDAFSVSGPTGPSSLATPTFTWPATEAGLAADCQLVNGTTAQTSVGCSSPYQPTLTVDGTWTLRVTTRDLAGNATTAVSAGYVFDTTPPTTPVVHPPASPGRDVQPSWTVDVEPGTAQECRIQNSAGSVLSDWTSCTVPVTTDLTGQPDGGYVLSVRSTDAAALTSPVGSSTYVLDTQAPDAPVLTLRTGTPGNTRSVPFAFTTEPGATVVCVLTRGGAVLSTQTGCTSPSSVSLTGLAEGPYVISATATDRAGNSSPTASATYVLDVTAPAVPLLAAAPVPIGSGRSPSWSFTTEARAVVTCRLVGTSFSVADSACSGGTYTPDLTGAPDDTYTFFAYATDEAGNLQRSPLTGTYTLDSTAPTGPSALPLTQRTNQATVSWYVSTPGDRVVCAVTRTVGTVVATVQPFTDCGSPYVVTLPSDGLYTFLAHTIDAAGNLSANITATYRLDTVPPLSAVLTAPVSPSAGRSPSWTIASPETSPTATCSVSGPAGSSLPAAAPCAVSAAGTPFPLDLSGQPDGAYTLSVRLVDRAGNANVADATSTYVLDTRAPNAVIVTAPASPSSAKTPKWALVGDADATLECRLSGATVTGAFGPCAADLVVPGQGSFTADLTSKPDGTYTFTVRSRDSAGNIGPETTSGYTLDTVRPALPAPPVSDPSPSQQPVVTWTFTVEAGATAYCTLTSATKVITPEQVCTSPLVTDLTNQADGDFALALRAQDAAGNTSAPVSSHYVLDRTAPSGPLITGTPGSPSPDVTPTWHLKASDDKDLMECQLAGTPSPTWAACSDPVSFDLAPATSGSYQLLVRETDKAGNRSTVTGSDDYVLDPTASAPPEVAPPAVQRSNSTSPVFVISRGQGDVATTKLQCSVTRADGQLSKALPCAFGANTVQLDNASFDGPVVLSVRGVDAAGSVSGAGSATYSFDNLPPASPTVLAPDPNVSFDRRAPFTFGDVDDADHYVCELRKAGQPGPLPAVTCASPDSVTLPSFGVYTFSVWAVDEAGNRSSEPEAVTYTYLAPVPTLRSLKGPTSGSDATPTWTFSVPLGDEVECVLGLPGGQALSYTCTTPVTAARSVSLPLAQALLRADLNPSATRASSFTANLEGRPAGTYSLTARLTDSFGNLGDYGAKVLYRYTPATSGPNRISTTPQPGQPPATPPQGGSTTPQGTTPQAPGGSAPSGGGGQSAPRIPVAVGRGEAPKAAIPGLSFPRVPNLTEIPKAISRGITGLSQKPGIPILLAIVVVGFLLLQNQIDRRDPKLASAPVGAEPEMDFGPVLGRPGPTQGFGGGAPA